MYIYNKFDIWHVSIYECAYLTTFIRFFHFLRTKHIPKPHYNSQCHNQRSAHIGCYPSYFSHILSCKNIPVHIAPSGNLLLQYESHTSPCTNHPPIDTPHTFPDNSNSWNTLDTRRTWRISVTSDVDTIPDDYHKSIHWYKVVARYNLDVRRSWFRIRHRNLARKCSSRKRRRRSRRRYMVGLGINQLDNYR